MKIEDLFKENLKNTEMPINDSLWDKVNSGKNVINNNINTHNSLLNKLYSSIKSLSLTTKIIATAFGTVFAVGTAIVINQNLTNKTENNLITKNTNPSSTNIYKKIDTTKTTTNQDNFIITKEKNILGDKNFNFAKEKIILGDEYFDVSTEDNFTIEEMNMEWDYSIQNVYQPDPVILKNIIDTSISPETTTMEDMRTKSDYQIKIQIPNILTPNGDGINDCFIIKNIENYSNNRLIIFNRNGNKIYEKDNYNNEYCPQKLLEDTYFYRLIVNNKGFEKTFDGVITVIY